jgi:BlaI family penicillinase repressor
MKVPRISEAEWLVMKVFWTHSPLTANAVVDELSAATKWSDKTIKTLINRLMKKGALGFKRQGRMYVYHPRVAEADCAREEGRSFLRRVYGGAVTPMLAAFLEEQHLSACEIEELKRILDHKGRS